MRNGSARSETLLPGAHTSSNNSRSANKPRPKTPRPARTLKKPASALADTLRARFGFTKAESAVAVALIDGLSYSEIAEKLGVSYHTVHTHVKAIHQKAGVSTTGRLTARIRGALEKPK